MLSKIPTARLFLSSRLLPELHLRMKIHQGTCVQLSLNLTGTVSRQTVRHCLVSPINICTRRCWSKQSHFSGHLITAPAGRRNSLRTVTTVNGGDEDHRCYDVDTDELVTMVQRNNENTSHMLLVDVREPEELLQTGEIPGSINIPLGEVEEAFSMSPDDFEISYGVDKPPTDNPNIIFTCLSGVRSLVALEFVHQLGYCSARHYKKGWLGWEQHLEQVRNFDGNT
ncbi:uncharacterized protein LOC135341525 [Halichondria panicea]|uniref:uncharacterized protein LOC135341525 n=1 Tax=Halichondria panicea TaxID=6063 RepID=UPI00312B595D